MVELSLVIFLLGILSCFTKKVHLLRLFISIEFLMLGLTLLCVRAGLPNVSLVMLVISFAVCEARVCLAFIVSCMRRHGTDLVWHIKSF